MFSKLLSLFVMLMVNLWWTLPASSGKKACSCYTFHGDLRRWYQSRQHCLDNGGDLVSLETIDEWSRINDEIQHRTTDRFGSNEWHIGLTNLTGAWRWMNNITLTYDRWQEGEPEHVTNKPFVTMAKNWPIGTQGLFNSLREDIPRARICEYERSCISIIETCRKLAARFSVTTPNPVRLSTTLFPKYMTTRTSEHKTNPVFKGENPTYKSNSKEKTPLYIMVIIIILGALIFGCCCIVIVAYRWKKRRKTEKNTKEEDETSHKAAIKTHDCSDSSNDSDEFEGDSKQDTAENEPNIALNDSNSRHDHGRTPPLRHEYAEIMIVEHDDNGCSAGEDDGNGRERIREHKVRFSCDENKRVGNECIPSRKRNHQKKEDYNSNGSYLVEHCKKHHDGNKKNGNAETTSPRVTVNYRKQKELKINEKNDSETVKRQQQQEDSHDMEIVKLDVAVPTKDAQYASIVEIYPYEHESILNRNKKPFLKTFAPFNGYQQNGRDFEEYEQNGRNYEQNGKDFEYYEQNDKIFDQYEQNGRKCDHHGKQFDERDLTMSTSVDKLANNSYTRPNEAVYAVVDKSKKTNKKAVYPNVRMNYVELADFDKNAVLYTKMPPRYQATRYTEVEIPNEWD